jgi:hypothetical protein
LLGAACLFCIRLSVSCPSLPVRFLCAMCTYISLSLVCLSPFCLFSFYLVLWFCSSSICLLLYLPFGKLLSQRLLPLFYFLYFVFAPATCVFLLFVSPTTLLTLFVCISKKRFFWIFSFYVRYSTLLHLPPLRFHCVGGSCVRTQDSCDYGIDALF